MAWLVAAGGAVIAALLAYGAYLWTRVWLHLRQQRAQQHTRNESLCESIRTIAWATLEKQCEPGEAAVRICVLLDHLVLVSAVAFPARFPALHSLYDAIREQPTHDARNALSKQERFRLDKALMAAERQWEAPIQPELQALSQFRWQEFNV